MRLFGHVNVDELIASQDMQGLIECLEQNDPLAQFKAADALAHFGQREGYDFFYTSLQHPKPAICCAAIEALSELRDPRAVEYIIPLLEDSNDEVRETALAGLAQINTYDAMQAVEAYQQQHKQPEPEVQSSSESGDWMEEPDPIMGVIPGRDALSMTASPAQERKAAEELYIMADHHQEEGCPMQALGECNRAISLAPDWADLYNLKGILLEDQEEPYLAMLAYQRAVKLDPSLAAAADNLKELHRELQVLDEPLADLIEAASTGDWQDRCDAIASLNQRQEPEVVEAIACLLYDEDPEVATAGLDALLASDLPAASQALEAYYNSFQADEDDEAEEE